MDYGKDKDVGPLDGSGFLIMNYELVPIPFDTFMYYCLDSAEWITKNGAKKIKVCQQC